MNVKIAGGFRVSPSSKSAARAHFTIPTVISTHCMISSALSDCRGLRNSTVPQVLVLFRLHASSRSGAARIISSSVELASSTKGNVNARLFVSIAWTYKSHNLELSSFDLYRWLGAAKMPFLLCSGSAPQFSVLNTTNPWRAASNYLETILPKSQYEYVCYSWSAL